METTILQAGELQVTLERTASGVRLASIRDGKSGALLTSGGYLFQLTAQNLTTNEELVVSSDTDFAQSAVTLSGNVCAITCSSSEKLPGVSVCVTATLFPEQNKLQYMSAVCSENPDYTVLSCDYPTLWFDVKDSVKFLSPYGCGEAIESDSALFGHGFRSGQEYPSYGASFQYMAAWDEASKRCLYYGIHDPEGAPKKMWFIREVNAPQMCIKASQPLCGIDAGCNSQSLYGCCVWQLTDGDWYDATLLYRDWMTKHAIWVPESDGTFRKDAGWVEDIDAWLLVHIRDEHFADGIIRAAKKLNVRTAVHLYLWHSNPFDNDYPHYFPEKPFLREQLARIQAEGIRVIPYINGRLWDTRDRGLEDWQFTARALPFACKGRDGKPFTESYSAKEANGEHTVLAVMCPSTALWQDTMREVTDKLVNDIGFDGVYLDQIAAAKAQPCADRRHHHPAGGGNWWIQSYNLLMDKVNQNKPGAVYATECTAEMFMKHIQLYLSWMWEKNGQVPAFPVLYSDKVATFGISYHSIRERDPDGMVIFYAQSLLFGEQMGWMAPDFFDVMPEQDYFLRCVKMRETLHNVLSHGIMLRPPVLTDDAPRLHSENAMHAYFHTVDYPAVQGALWLEKESGKRVLLLANAQTVSANVQMETELPDGTYTLCGSADAPLPETLVISGGKASMTLPAHTVAYVKE